MTNLAKGIALVALATWAAIPPQAAEPPPKVKVEFRRAETKAAEGLTEATVVGSDTKIYLHKTAELTNEDVASARAIDDKDKGPMVEIVFTKEGAKKAAKLSEEHADKPVAILIDGKVVSAPTVRAKFGEKVQITGKYTKEEAEKLAKGIKAD
jgi:preprotein translocase subunit SecD